MTDPVSTLATVASTEVGKEVLSKPSQAIGKTLTDIWEVVFGLSWSEKRQKKEIAMYNNIEKFKEEISTKSQQIPEENRQEPEIDIVGSVLEASKFKVNKEEIRDMFSNILVSAMDNSKAENIHPSFVEMIKQLSSLDAQNLYYLYHGKDETISQIRFIIGQDGHVISHTHIFLGNPNIQDNNVIAPSIDNLIRLKLIDVSYEQYKTDDSLYDKHRNNSLFQECKVKLEDNNKRIGNLLSPFLDDNSEIYDEHNNLLSHEERLTYKASLEKQLFDDVKLQKGTIELTDLGKIFCRVCLN